MGVERKGPEGAVDRFDSFPCFPSANPSPLFLKAKIEKGPHWLQTEKLFSGMDGRAGEVHGQSGHVPAFETASCVRRKHEKLEGGQMEFYQICISNRKVGVVEK